MATIISPVVTSWLEHRLIKPGDAGRCVLNQNLRERTRAIPCGLLRPMLA